MPPVLRRTATENDTDQPNGGAVNRPQTDEPLQDPLGGGDVLQDPLAPGGDPANDPSFGGGTMGNGKPNVEATTKPPERDEERKEDDQPAQTDAAAKTGGQGSSAPNGGPPGDAPPAEEGGGGGGSKRGGGKSQQDEPEPERTETDERGEAQGDGSGGGGGGGGGSPEDDPGLQALQAEVTTTATEQQEHPTGDAAASDAQGAAPSPANEVPSQAAAGQISTMEDQEPKPFDKTAFKTAILEAIQDATPQSNDELRNFSDSGATDNIVNQGQTLATNTAESSAQPIAQANEEAPDEGAITPREEEELTPPEVGEVPALNAADAAPDARPDAELNLDAGPQELDEMMAAEDITDEQLLSSNEPSFVESAGAVADVEADAATSPGETRNQETAVLTATAGGMQSTVDAGLGAMHSSRAQLMGEAQGAQSDTMTADTSARQTVATEIQNIYDDTQKKVTDRLTKLDHDVDTTFTAGAERAAAAFEQAVDDKVDSWGGAWAKVKSWVGLDAELESLFMQCREVFIREMNSVVEDVANVVETGLNEVQAIIRDGRARVQEYVEQLPEDLKSVGEEAAEEISGRFDALDEQVTAKQQEIQDRVTQKAVEAVNNVDAQIQEMREANKSLLDRAKDLVGGTIQAILQLKDMLLGVLARAQNAVKLVLKDPIEFLGNLISGVGAGLRLFMSKIGEHLKTGFMEWLFGAVGELGLTMPETFDLKGVLDLALQVMGLTKERFRARAVELLGEPTVLAIETGVEIFKIVMSEGVSGLWQWIQQKIGDLKEMVLGGVKEFIVQRVIMGGITYIIGMLNPAGAFIKACQAIYKIIMFFVERGSQIMSLVNAVIDTVTAVAQGNTDSMAAAIDNALGRAVPVAIGFLANLLGVSGISDKIRDGIQNIQSKVWEVIDWLINKAKELGAGLLEKLGLGGKKKEGEQPTNESNHQEMVNKAIEKLEKPVEGEASYEEVLAKKKEEARQIENENNPNLEAPVKMTISFDESDNDEGDIDFTVLVAPNNSTGDGVAKVTGVPPELGIHPIPDKTGESRESHHYPQNEAVISIKQQLGAIVKECAGDKAKKVAVAGIKSLPLMQSNDSSDGTSAILMSEAAHTGKNGAHSRSIADDVQNKLSTLPKDDTAPNSQGDSRLSTPNKSHAQEEKSKSNSPANCLDVTAQDGDPLYKQVEADHPEHTQMLKDSRDGLCYNSDDKWLFPSTKGGKLLAKGNRSHFTEFGKRLSKEKNLSQSTVAPSKASFTTPIHTIHSYYAKTGRKISSPSKPKGSPIQEARILSGVDDASNQNERDAAEKAAIDRFEKAKSLAEDIKTLCQHHIALQVNTLILEASERIVKALKESKTDGPKEGHPKLQTVVANAKTNKFWAPLLML